MEVENSLIFFANEEVVLSKLFVSDELYIINC